MIFWLANAGADEETHFLMRKRHFPMSNAPCSSGKSFPCRETSLPDEQRSVLIRKIISLSENAVADEETHFLIGKRVC